MFPKTPEERLGAARQHFMGLVEKYDKAIENATSKRARAQELLGTIEEAIKQGTVIQVIDPETGELRSEPWDKS